MPGLGFHEKVSILIFLTNKDQVFAFVFLACSINNARFQEKRGFMKKKKKNNNNNNNNNNSNNKKKNFLYNT